MSYTSDNLFTNDFLSNKVTSSAGVGRTGTFIVIDAIMEQIHYEKELDVYSYVTKIRSQRNYMVQKAVSHVPLYRSYDSFNFSYNNVN
jgi:protein tyrosine phosphatase